MTDTNAENRRHSLWQIALAWLKSWDEAASLTYDDIQDRRIEGLKAEVAELRTIVDQLQGRSAA